MSPVLSNDDGRAVPADIWSVPGRSTRAVINLDAIAGNLRCFRAHVTATTRIMAVVKANGYGHGAVMVARTALESGANELAVATVDEGLQLRGSGIRAPILILGPVDESEIGRALHGDLSISVANTAAVHAIACAASASSNGPAPIHLKIDTGMRRFGALTTEAVAVSLAIASEPSLSLAGTFTHFASADETDESVTLEQLAEFDSAIAAIRSAGVDPGSRHVANSAATLRSRRYDHEMVRVGIALYGIAPSSEIALFPGMRPALTIHSRVRRVIHLQAGDRVSYGGTYRADRTETAALIPIGYADGYHRLLSNQGWMAIGTETAPIRGRVCMDQTVIGWPSAAPLDVGREVVVVGNGTDAAPTLSQLAELAGTIPYELATALASRVPRIYLRKGHIVAIEDLGGLRDVAGGRILNGEATGYPVAPHSSKAVITPTVGLRVRVRRS